MLCFMARDQSLHQETLVNATDIQWIDSSAALNDLLRRAASHPWLAVDTEFVREKTYYPQAGLIQIATATEIACIDPLAFDQLDPLFALLSNPNVVKVFHAAGQDLELLGCLGDQPVRPLFDTQIALQLLGQGDQLSYAALVEGQTGIQLSKSQTRTNWLKRPISKEQLQYAADDVRYLGAIYESLANELKQRGRLDWMWEITESLGSKSDQDIDADRLLNRLKGQQELHGVQRAIARELLSWRETTARERNLPRRWILGDELIVQIAMADISRDTDLNRISGLKPALITRHGNAILRAIERGKTLAPAQWPQEPVNQRPSPETLRRYKALRKIVTDIATRANISPSLIATRKDLEALAEDPQADSPILHGWRYQLAGKPLCDFLERHPLEA